MERGLKMRQPKIHLFGIFGVMGLFGVLAGYGLDYILNDQRAPIVAFTQTEALNSPIEKYEPLKVRIWRKKVRDDCTVTALRNISNTNGQLIPIESSLSMTVGGVDADYLDWSYTIPQHVPPGQYYLHVHLIYDCPKTTPFNYSLPVTPFIIKGETAP